MALLDTMSCRYATQRGASETYIYVVLRVSQKFHVAFFFCLMSGVFESPLLVRLATVPQGCLSFGNPHTKSLSLFVFCPRALTAARKSRPVLCAETKRFSFHIYFLLTECDLTNKPILISPFFSLRHKRISSTSLRPFPFQSLSPI